MPRNILERKAGTRSGVTRNGPPPPSFGELEWSTACQTRATTTRGDRRLILVIESTGKRWAAMALETTAALTEEADPLANHGHKVVGSYESFLDAVGACQSFALCWQKQQKATRVAECACEEFDPPANNARAHE